MRSREKARFGARPFLTAVAVGALLLAGCSTLQLPGTLYRGDDIELLLYASSLTRLDAAERGEAMVEAQHRWRLTQNPRDRARLGLARGQWGHDGYDPAAAAEDIAAALAGQTANWSDDERRFLELRQAQLTYLAQREDELARARQERAQLRRALDDAQRKLQAITDIERSLGRDLGR